MPIEKMTGAYLFKESIAHQATIMRTSLLKKNPYRTDFRIASDYDFFVHTYFYENIKDAAYQDILTNYDCGGISSTQSWLGAEERKKSFISQTSPVIYADYQRLVYGENLLEKWICKFRGIPFFYWSSIAFLSPLYACYCLRSLLYHFSFFCKRFKNFMVKK